MFIVNNLRPVRLAYQPPASSTFLSEQTSNQPAVLFSQNKSAPAISHQPTEQALSPQLLESTYGQLSVSFARIRAVQLLTCGSCAKKPLLSYAAIAWLRQDPMSYKI
jgi:hypothetical protein